MDRKDKVRGRQVEINNGRLAMLGIFSFLAESKAPGAVPPLTGLIPEYSGNYMVPFEGDFSIFFVSPEKPESARPQTVCDAGKEEMAALAEANPDFLGRSIGLWDPLGALDTNFWGLGNEQTIGYLRHAEIKHGRVAMAAFLGYIVQSTPLVSGPHNILPFRGYEPGLTPPEQWDAIPLYGKLQILVLVGMLESYGEILDPHYTQGGLPGYYPPIKGRRPELAFNLYNPFDWNMDRKDKVRGRQVEINNGRLAMLGIFSFLAESKAPGAVPPLTGLIPEYSGNYMVPFEGDFSIFFVSPEKPSQNTRPSTECYASDFALESQALETQEDLKSLAKSLNPAVGYYDPLNIGEEDWSLWNYNNERKIAWFRQAEIKHGRVAMAAFVGYCVQANGGHWFTKMTLGGADWPTGTPPEQWDALPEASKWQIILFVGVLEAFDESIPPHYTNGRKPGEFPSFSETYKAGKGIPHPVPFDLYDPFGFSKNASPEKKARGLRIEINNGRLAMLAVFGFMSASKVPGSVPALADIIPPYNGDYMIPFEGNFNIFG